MVWVQRSSVIVTKRKLTSPKAQPAPDLGGQSHNAAMPGEFLCCCHRTTDLGRLTARHVDRVLDKANDNGKAKRQRLCDALDLGCADRRNCWSTGRVNPCL
jgi:hypothetical protein